MGNLMKADMYKFKKSVAFKVYIIISFICIGLLGLILHNIATGDMDAEILSTVSLLMDAMMVSLLSSLMIGTYICGDFQSKTIHSEIACTTRAKVIIVKVLSSMFVTALIALPYAIVSVICFASKAEFASFNGVPSLFISILNNSEGVKVTGSAIGKSVFLGLLGVFIYTARMSLCIPVAFKVRKPVAVMTIGIVAAFGFDMLTQAVKDVPVIGDIFNNTPYAVIYDINMNSDAGVIVKSIVVSVIFIIVMVLITYLMFRKSEIK